MKKILFFLMASIIAYGAIAQTPTYILSNTKAQVVKSLTTTNATATTIATVTPIDDEVGIVRIEIVGMATDTLAGVTGCISYRYIKSGGTLTLGSVVTHNTIVADSELSGATFSASAVSNNIAVRVTGVLDETIYWKALITRMAVQSP
jgi:hypothetical protein